MEVATNILARARELGLALKAEGGAIAVRPKGAMPPELAAAIRAHKPELLAFLRGESVLSEESHARAAAPWRNDDAKILKRYARRSPAGGRSCARWVGTKSASGAVHSGRIAQDIRAGSRPYWSLTTRSPRSLMNASRS